MSDRINNLRTALDGCDLNAKARELLSTRLAKVEFDLHEAMLSGHEFIVDKANSELDILEREITSSFVGGQDEKTLITLVKQTPKKRTRGQKMTAGAEVGTACGCDETPELHESQYFATCVRCGQIIEAAGSLPYERTDRSNEKASTNKEIETANDMLSMIQGGIGRETNGKSTLQTDIHRNSEVIMRQLTINYPTKNITLEGVRVVLRGMSLRRLCKIAPYFYYQFTGQTPLRLTEHEVSRIMETYARIVKLWHERPKSDDGFKNLPNCRETIYKIILGLNIDDDRRRHILEHIYLPEESTISKFIREFWIPMQAFAASRNVSIEPTPM